MTPACPICGKPVEGTRARPFCSPRCADVDLGRWFAGLYAVPDERSEHDEEPDPAAPSRG